MPLETKTPIALTIAGSDSGGGAGIQADIKTFSAFKVYATSVITAVTAQNTCTVNAVQNIDADIVQSQIETVLSDIPVDAIKIGMLSTAPLIERVAQTLLNTKLPIILDPVMVAKSGDRLLEEDALQTLREKLLPIATLITPNLPEAADLLGINEATTNDQAIDQAKQLIELGAKAVLMKGGHAKGETCTDILLLSDGTICLFEAKRIDTKNTHGTGCTLSAAIAAGFAKGQLQQTAVQNAHTYLHKAILSADQLKIGRGHGPVHHFHEMWSPQ